jgi:hypothetical protein
MAGEKLVKTGIKRDKDTLYWVGSDGVYGKRRKMPGVADGKKQKVADHDLKLDYSKYLYFVDKDGDVARKERQVGGSKRKKSSRKASAPKRAAKRGGKKGAKKGAKAKKGGKKGGKKGRR